MGSRRGARRMSFFSSRRRRTRSPGDWSSDVCSSDLSGVEEIGFTRWMQRAAISQKCKTTDRKSVVQGKSVDLGGRRIIKKKKHGGIAQESNQETDPAQQATHVSAPDTT